MLSFHRNICSRIKKKLCRRKESKRWRQETKTSAGGPIAMSITPHWVEVYNCLLGSDISFLCLPILLPLSPVIIPGPLSLLHWSVRKSRSQPSSLFSQPLLPHSDLHFPEKVKELQVLVLGQTGSSVWLVPLQLHKPIEWEDPEGIGLNNQCSSACCIIGCPHTCLNVTAGIVNTHEYIWYITCNRIGHLASQTHSSVSTQSPLQCLETH